MSKRSTKRQVKSYKDAVADFLAATTKESACASIQRQLDKNELSLETARRAAKHLVDAYRNSDLVGYLEQQYPRKQRGALPPAEGTSRPYIMQADGEGRTFLRTPGGHTRVRKGGKCRMHFLPGDRILIEPASRPPPARIRIDDARKRKRAA